MADFLPDPQTPLSREGFLRLGLGMVVGHLAQQVEANPVVAAASAQRFRPPGAVATFTDLCQPFCSACAQACPKGAITADPFGLAMLDPAQTPCVLCTDVPCTAVCPSGALARLTDPSQIRLGVAQIDPASCIAYSGDSCTACVDSCPVPGAMVAYDGLPNVVPDVCTGCGLCLSACPVPGAIGVSPKSF